jgi:hypothetical protein
MKVVLLRKLAEEMDGVDVSGYTAGDIVDLPRADARLLIAEQWAIPDRRTSVGGHCVERRRHHQSPARADDEVEQAS